MAVLQRLNVLSIGLLVSACGARTGLADLDGVNAPPAEPPSCAPGGPGMTNCGATSESCCTSPEVKGGTYYRSYDGVFNDGGIDLAADGGPAGLAYPATVSGFRLDKYDVTVGRFRQFVGAWNGGYSPPEGSGKHTYLNGGRGLANSGDPGTYELGWDAVDWNPNVAPTDANLASCTPWSTWTSSASTQENLPINCMNWYEAYAFCIWDEGFLPSAAEGGYAAAGGSEQREYPWGSAEPGTSSRYAIYNCYFPNGAGDCTRTLANIAPVGTATLGAGAWGQLDLAGNVAQWKLDWYAPYVDPCTDCAYLTPASYRVVEGSAFNNEPSGLLSSDVVVNNPPTVRYDLNGVRCARSAS
jgi:sulfatase modifying factor 1